MIVYVAAPYSNVKDKNHLMLTIADVSGQYMKDNPGEYTITGLVHHYACQLHDDIGTDWNFWKDFCEQFIKKCDKLLVIRYEGWDKSFGVAEEIRLANELGIPVVYTDPKY